MNLAKDAFSDHSGLVSEIACNKKSWFEMQGLSLFALFGGSCGSTGSSIAMIRCRCASLGSSPNSPRNMKDLLRIDLKSCQIEPSLLQEVKHSLHVSLRRPVVPRMWIEPFDSTVLVSNDDSSCGHCFSTKKG